MLERTLVFVDTSYLLASFYNSWEIGARAQLEIDLPEVVATLGKMITNQLNQPIHRQFWYDGIPDSGPHRYQRALRTCDGVQLRTGQLIEWGERRTQKGVDTRLVADLVVNGVSEKFTDFVLVSGDADMIPGVEEVTSRGARMHLYGFGWDSMSSALRHACDSTTILDPREDFADAMRLQVLEGPLPPSIRERPLNDAAPLEEADGPTAVPGLGPDPLRPDAGAAGDNSDSDATSDAASAGASSAPKPGQAPAAAPAAPAAPKPSDIVGTPTSQQRTHRPDEPEMDEPSEAQVEANNESNKPGNQNVSSEPDRPSAPAPSARPVGTRRKREADARVARLDQLGCVCERAEARPQACAEAVDDGSAPQAALPLRAASRRSVDLRRLPNPL
ncbi:NYN domain-containing protein [Corynebacterium haemomassiliense]|uniref:NYN domain-containing protein n=1 Tax=Corynebacterium haemomassiliense TaxID=2754726 RepID=UPI001F2F75EF|nr:NYN domain-containing protein [Corynebacterium haemomassiliense]